MVISREPLRSKIRSHLVERLVGGDLEPGAQIDEGEITEELGVSRTPLREALVLLEFQGLLSWQPGRGFSVAALQRQEMEELFDLCIELESLCLRMGGGVTEDVLEEMRAVNDRRAELAEDGGARETHIELDDRWHRLLVSGCDNAQLLEILYLVRRRLYRYIYAFLGDKLEVNLAIRDHEEVMDALEQDDLELAVDRLRQHGRAGEDALRRMMGKRATKTA